MKEQTLDIYADINIPKHNSRNFGPSMYIQLGKDINL